MGDFPNTPASVFVEHETWSALLASMGAGTFKTVGQQLLAREAVSVVDGVAFFEEVTVFTSAIRLNIAVTLVFV